MIIPVPYLALIVSIAIMLSITFIITMRRSHA
jgi:hypothetical protein